MLDGGQLPTKKDGPVAVAILCNLGEDFRSHGEAPVPAAWAEVARAAGTALGGDEVVTLRA